LLSGDAAEAHVLSISSAEHVSGAGSDGIV
jgi:hypothetical protein